MTMMNSEQSLSSMVPQLASFDPERFAKANPQDMKRIVTWAQEQFTMAKNARVQAERQWKINLAFYYGRQNVVFRSRANLVSGNSGQLWEPPAPYWRSRPIINRIRPVIRSEIAKLTSQKPSASIVPNSSEDIDFHAARAGEQIWESLYRRNVVKNVIRRAAFWTTTCGTGFIKTFWDPSAIDTDSDQMGDVKFQPETPFHVLVPDLRQEDLELQPFVMHAQVRPRAQMEMKYQRPFANAKGREEILEDAYLNMIGASNAEDKNSVLCVEIWVKPGAVPIFPEGAFFTMIGDDIVQGGEGIPYAHNKYPFAKIDHIPTGKFYGDSTIVDLLPIQREFNRTRGQVIEAKNKMGKPQLIAPAGSVDPRKITTEPGIVIEYTPGFDPPQPLPLAPLPAYVLQELDRLLLDFSDISGQHEVSRGGVPPGVTAATAISYLQEQDESMLSHTFDSLEEAIEKTAFMTLGLVSQFWDTKRTIRVVGVDGSFEARAFKGADLRGNTDIRIEGGSSLPTSKAAKQAFIMDLMKMGFIPPDKGLEVMEIGGINRIYDELATDVREAQRENLKMAGVTQEQYEMWKQSMAQMVQMDPMVMMPKTGEAETAPMDPRGMPQFPCMVPVNKWNNHRVHIEVHNKYRKSQAFDQAPPWVKEIFDQHINMHVDEIVKGQLAQVPTEVTDQMGQQGLDPFTQGALQEAQQNEQLAAGAPQEGGMTGGNVNAQQGNEPTSGVAQQPG